MLELNAISKKFGEFQALDRVNFHVNAGEIVGLLGENGAGKSTLLGIVSGNLAPTSGEIKLQGKPLHLKSARDATMQGIGIVHQHFRLVPSFTVAENIALAAPQGPFKFSRKMWEERIVAWAQELDWRVDPARKVEELGVGERQRVEILKALYAHDGDSSKEHAANVLLLDEPTANLTPAEVEELFEVLARLKAQGRAVVFVSHKLGEVLSLCDRVTVLRHGTNSGERVTKDTNATDLASLMVGRDFENEPIAAPGHLPSEEHCLEIKNLRCGLLHDFSLKVRRGEIVGLAGVDGNGQAELVEILSGLKKPESGSFETPGHLPIAVIPPDRQHVGLIPPFTLFENIALNPDLRRECKKPLRFDWNIAKSRTRELMQQFDVRAPHTKENAAASQLSGGNQQKLVIARALSFPHCVVVAADPARGLDVAATQFVHQQLMRAAAEGAGVLLISTDLDEVLRLGDRIGVLYEGRLLPGPELLPHGTAREEIGKLMGGLSSAGHSTA